VFRVLENRTPNCGEELPNVNEGRADGMGITEKMSALMNCFYALVRGNEYSAKDVAGSLEICALLDRKKALKIFFLKTKRGQSEKSRIRAKPW